MPPAKRKPAQQAPDAAAPVRVTRAAAKRSALAISNPPPEEKKVKKAKKAKASSGGRKKKNEKEVSASVKADKEEEIEEDEEEASSKTIVVEHCKQCNQFKMRANLVKERLEKADCGVNVILNPEKPRRGCFEIRQEGGKKFISLLDMKRPFKPMRDLDMDKVISDIIDEISNT
ncbi:selenoprotein H [Vigna radiata var. radiata]|uniref:Selenoprotein H n=1 Tax=Vigna radiata var. radiata TaxID=3916 RepID=A0A1S3UD56_VIGRR|nr:selenoprotein H [Vigna radiata var. radiata]